MGLSFACKPFQLGEVVRCGLGLSRAEMRVLENALGTGEFTVAGLAARLRLDRTTVQKGVSKLLEKGLLKRLQKNRDAGGYEYSYTAPTREQVRARVRHIAGEWFALVGKGLESWP